MPKHKCPACGSKYTDSDICDGTQWEIVIRFPNGGKISKYGSNEYPPYWSKIPKHIQEKLLENVFCSICGTTAIVDYSMHDDNARILLKGKCKKCNKVVARLIEDLHF